MEEIWKPIKDQPDYFVSNLGNVRYKDNPNRTPQMSRTGYYDVKIRNKGYRIHRLVAENFIPNPENKPQVNHIDGNRLNNKIDNLEWVTGEENLKHVVDNGLNIKKISLEDRQIIVDMYQEGYSLREIGEKFNICHESVRYYILRSDVPLRKGGRSKIDTQKIINAFQKGLSYEEIAKKLNCHPATIRNRLKEENVVSKDFNRCAKVNNQDLLKDYSNGLSTKEMAKKYNCTSPTIRKHLKQEGIRIERKPVKRKENPSVFAEKVLNAFDFGLSLQGLKRVYKNKDYNLILKILKDNNRITDEYVVTS